MEVEIYQPPPAPPPSPPAPPHKYRSAVGMGLLFAVAFLGTLAVLSRHELAGMIPQHVSQERAPDVLRRSPESARDELSAETIRNIERAVTCIPASTLVPEGPQQLTRMLTDQAKTSDVSAFATGSFDPQHITPQQKTEFLGLLAQIRGMFGTRARQGFEQALGDGACRLEQ